MFVRLSVRGEKRHETRHLIISSSLPSSCSLPLPPPTTRPPLRLARLARLLFHLQRGLNSCQPNWLIMLIRFKLSCLFRLLPQWGRHCGEISTFSFLCLLIGRFLSMLLFGYQNGWIRVEYYTLPSTSFSPFLPLPPPSSPFLPLPPPPPPSRVGCI